jgi:SAM-dependent methyltransferase
MLKNVMAMFDEKLLFPYRYGKLTQRMLPLLDRGSTVLDVGTGDGHLAHHLTQSSGCHIIGLDVCLQPHTYIDVHHYDGCVFPFQDNTFDCVMMVDMLHHTTNIDEMLSEARRVSRQHILIKDHFWNNRIDKAVLHMADYLGNIPYNVPLPYNYLRLEEWGRLFRRHKLSEVSRATFKYSRLEPAQHIMVRLQVDAIPARPGVHGRHPNAHHTHRQQVEHAVREQL